MVLGALKKATFARLWSCLGVAQTTLVDKSRDSLFLRLHGCSTEQLRVTRLRRDCTDTDVLTLTVHTNLCPQPSPPGRESFTWASVSLIGRRRTCSRILRFPSSDRELLDESSPRRSAPHRRCTSLSDLRKFAFLFDRVRSTAPSCSLTPPSDPSLRHPPVHTRKSQESHMPSHQRSTPRSLLTSHRRRHF